MFVIDEMQYLSKEEKDRLVRDFSHGCPARPANAFARRRASPRCAASWGRPSPMPSGFFAYSRVDSLVPDAARQALEQPAAAAGVAFARDALDEIVEKTQCYPYFLQEWGKQAWNVSKEPLVTAEQVVQASCRAQARLDEGFFSVRFDRLTRMEKRYVRAMADLLRQQKAPRAGENSQAPAKGCSQSGADQGKADCQGNSLQPCPR